MDNSLNNKSSISSAKKDKWITVINKRSQIKKKENDIYNKINMVYNYDDDNTKKILCNNILTMGECHYGNKCMYAHSLDEQNIEPIRKKAYDILNDKGIINYRPDRELGKIFLQMTKVCEDCAKHKCPGGYNCKYGVCDKKYQICADDLRYGKCYNVECDNIHLTNKGLIPLNNTANKKDLQLSKSRSYIKNINIPNGILLSDDFFEKLHNEKNISESDSDESYERINNYLNYYSDSDESCNESIFS
jgi:hypothetical protein